MKNPTLSSAPHITSRFTTVKIMLDVLISLIPVIIASIIFFGIRALFIELICLFTAFFGEITFQKITSKPVVLDFSSAVSGLLLALSLPVTVPFYLAALGSLFAVIVVKGFCGNVGENVFNPALGARAFLLLVFPLYITKYPVDSFSHTTPLHQMQMGTVPAESLFQMFIGNIPGSLGEVSSLAIIIGAVYLIIRKVITPHIPLSYILTAAALAFLFPMGESAFLWSAYNVLGGGLLFAAVFMATDYSSSPMTSRAQIAYGILCGILTVIFRRIGIFPEGVTYAILIMNGFTLIIDQKLSHRTFGHKKGDIK